MLSKQGQGDCNAVCKSHPHWVLYCNKKVGSLTTNLKQIDKVDKASYFKGIKCKGWNKYDFGQGLSQCSSQCCNNGIYHCSVTTKWPGCKIPDKFAWDSHKRICPCSFFLQKIQNNSDNQILINPKENKGPIESQIFHLKLLYLR